MFSLEYTLGVQCHGQAWFPGDRPLTGRLYGSLRDGGKRPSSSLLPWGGGNGAS